MAMGKVRTQRQGGVAAPIISSAVLALAALLALTLSGCSSVTLAYSNAPQLLWWWVDGYFDFDRAQTSRVKLGIDELYDWHRSTQLSGLLPLLKTAQGQILADTSGEALCRSQAQAREALEPTLMRAVETAAEVVPSLAEAQYRALDSRYAKVIKTMRADYLQPDPKERHTDAVKRVLERAEMIYGRLDGPQRRAVDEAVAASPFDPQAWLAERLRRQRDTVQTLRRLQAERADRDTRVAALRAVVARVERSPEPEYRSYQQRLTTYNCELLARLHNSTTPKQRSAARDKLQGWADDIRRLAARD